MIKREIASIWLPVTILILATTSLAWAQDIQVVAKPLSEVNETTVAQAAAEVTTTNRSSVASEVNGVIAEVMYDVSETVKKGATLARLDPRDFELQLAQAQANLQSQEARIRRGEVRLKRALELAESNFLSEDELLERQTDLDVLQADRQVQQVSVASAERELSKTIIVAPFDGVIVERNAQVGAFASRAAALFTVSEIGKPTLTAQVSNGDVESVENSQVLWFKSDGQQWPVTIKSISPVLDNRSRVQTVKLSFPKDQPLVGTSGYLVWERPERVVATDIVVRRNGRLGIFLLRGQTAKFHILGNAQEGRPATVSLPDDTLIIVEGQQRIQDGDQVVNAP